MTALAKVLAIKSAIRVIAYTILSRMNMCPFFQIGVSYFGGHTRRWLETGQIHRRLLTSIRKIQIFRRGHPLPVWNTGSHNPAAHSQEPRNDGSTDGLCCVPFCLQASRFSTPSRMLRILRKDLCAGPSATCIWHLNQLCTFL